MFACKTKYLLITCLSLFKPQCLNHNNNFEAFAKLLIEIYTKLVERKVKTYQFYVGAILHATSRSIKKISTAVGRRYFQDNQ